MDYFGSVFAMVACIVMSAYFSATETAFSSLNKTRLKVLADNGNKRAALALKLSEDYDNATCVWPAHNKEIARFIRGEDDVGRNGLQKAPPFVFSNYHIGLCRGHSVGCVAADAAAFHNSRVRNAIS